MSPEQYTVAEFMDRNVHTISSDETLKTAMRIMRDTNTNCLVVINKENKVSGIVSLLDVIRQIVPDYLEEHQQVGAFEAGSLFMERVTEFSQQPILEFMTKKVHVIEENHTLIQAAALLSEHRIHQLPVVDAQGTLVGFIGRSDIKRAIGSVLEL